MTVQEHPQSSVSYRKLSSKNYSNNTALPKTLHPRVVKPKKNENNLTYNPMMTQSDEYELELRQNEAKIDSLLKNLEINKKKILKR